ncbi:seminase-like [Cochliomyia hominivorax]
MVLFLVIRTLLFLFLLQQHQIRTSAAFNETEESSRIVGGVVTSINKAKYVVSLRRRGKFTCGGTLVTPNFVVTAAHCVEGLKASDVSVTGGATYLSDKGVKRSVTKIYIPKNYIANVEDMDIAVLELSSALKGSNISTIQLCKTPWRPNDQITVYGWGQTSEYNENSSNQLRTVSVPIIEQTKCREMYKGYGKITRSMFCAGNLKGKDACIGDSGGPAIFKNQLCGVVSWGRGCARRQYPGVYTNIMYVRDFIDKSMKRMIYGGTR